MSPARATDAQPVLQIGFIVDFNPHNFGSSLVRSARPLAATLYPAPFGQALQTLRSPHAVLW
jgi:hypothetical protein